jgi:protein gp37
MSSATSIEWTKPPGYRGGTWNPTIGCRRVSTGCEHCYAEQMARRIVAMGGPAAERYRQVVKFDEAGRPRATWNGRFLELPAALSLPLATSAPTCWFVDSMSDLFGEGISDAFIMQVWMTMARAGHHLFLILTKRPERMATWVQRWADVEEDCDPVMARGPAAVRAAHTSGRALMFAEVLDGMGAPPAGCAFPTYDWMEGPRWMPTVLANVWLGTSVEDQPRANERIPHLLRVPAAVRFLSVEPMLGPVNLHPWLCGGCGDDLFCSPRADGISWVIVGGESGHGARPFDLSWARSIVDLCKAAGCACFVKQLGANPRPDCRDLTDRGEPSTRSIGDSRHLLAMRDRKGGAIAEWPEDLRVRQFPHTEDR